MEFDELKTVWVGQFFILQNTSTQTEIMKRQQLPPKEINISRTQNKNISTFVLITPIRSSERKKLWRLLTAE